MKSPEEQQPDSESPLRWSGLLQRSNEPLFVLNRGRRLLFVNRAWELLTGRKLDEVRGWVCKRRAGAAAAGSAEALQQALAPSPDALEGKTCRVRRRYLESAARIHWWDVEFLPLSDAEGVAGFIGKITSRAQPPSTSPPLPEKILALRQQVVEWYRLDQVGSEVPAVQRMVQQISYAAKMRVPVAIVGEAGAGKQWAARAIHYLTDPEQSFACLDCSSLPERFVSEVLSDGGLAARHGLSTLYLKEPSRLPREIQARLAEQLSVDKEQPPRILSGFAGDPREAIRSGHLLEDFYCSISAVTVEVPALRDRLSDLPWFIEHFLSRLADLDGSGVKEVAAEAQELLCVHTWPGNLRELFDVLRSAWSRAKTSHIEAGDLPYYLRTSSAPKERSIPLDKILEEVEKRLITLAMSLSQNNKTKAAELLAVWRPRLVRRLQSFGMAPNSEDT